MTDSVETADAVKRDDVFYYNLVTFRVEDCLFRVTKHPFVTQSQVFREMFAFPPGDGNIVDELSDEKPLRLTSVEEVEFRAFLRVLTQPERHSESMPLTTNMWKSVLRLSHMWGFDSGPTSLKQQAIAYLSAADVNDLEKLKLAYDFDVDPWRQPIYEKLIKQDALINPNEAPWLGANFFFRLSQAREFRYKALLSRAKYGLVVADIGVQNRKRLYAQTAADSSHLDAELAAKLKKIIDEHECT